MLTEAEAEAGGPVVVAAPSPDAPEESCPGSGASTVGSSTCSISHSMAWVTDMLQENKGRRKNIIIIIKCVLKNNAVLKAKFI